MRCLRCVILRTILAFVAIGLLTGLLAEWRGPTLKLTPGIIEVGAFYHGTRVRIEGTAKAGSKVVVIIRGPQVTEVFNKKARAGPIWINAAKVHISGAPSMFLCFSPEPVRVFLGREAIEKYQLDEAAIKKQMRIEPQGQDRDILASNYIKLKTLEGIYQVVANGVTMHNTGETGSPYAVDLQWPRKAPPDIYEVTTYECQNGLIVVRTSAPLKVVKVGFPAKMAALATEHASLYGLMAIVIAMIAGFGIDFLAARLGKAKVRPR